MVEQL